MSTTHDIAITPEDLAVLEEILNDPQVANESIRQAIRIKIANARIVFPADMPLDVITIGARVRFRVDNLEPDERILVKGAGVYPTGAAQCVTTPRGIALLGLAEGARIDVTDEAGSEVIHIISVLYQPEAARRIANIEDFSSYRRTPTQGQRPKPRPARPTGAPFWDDDDPGPSAA